MQDKSTGWSGRFSEPVDALVKRYTASVDFDKRLAEFDIQGSLAHANMLAAQAIMPPVNAKARMICVSGLRSTRTIRLRQKALTASMTKSSANRASREAKFDAAEPAIP